MEKQNKKPLKSIMMGLIQKSEFTLLRKDAQSMTYKRV